MALKNLIKNQTIRIDDHKRGCREIKEWDTSSDIHLDKTTNFPLNGKIQKVRIKIPINSDQPIKIVAKKEQKNIEVIPNNLLKEIKEALEDKEIRDRFILDVMDVLNNFDTALSNEERAKSVLTRISKHFDLNWPTDTIKIYAKEALLEYTLVYQKNSNEEYFAKLDKDKIEIGQYSGRVKRTYNK